MFIYDQNKSLKCYTWLDVVVFQIESSAGSVLILISHEDDEQHEDAVEEHAPDECARILLRSS